MTEIPMKRCTKCGQEFPATREYFRLNQYLRDRLDSHCKSCVKQYEANNRRRDGVPEVKRINPLAPTKICLTCRQEFPRTSTYFQRETSRTDGLREHCKSCTNKKKSKRCLGDNYERKTAEREQSRQLQAQGLKRCTCGDQCLTEGGPWLPANSHYFPVHSHSKSGLNSRCKLCHRNYQREQRVRYPERFRQYTRINHQRRRQRSEVMERTRLLNRRRRNTPEGKLKMQLNQQRRKARKRSLPDDFTVEDWQCALEYFNYCCATCGRSLVESNGDYTASLDHWIPLSDPCPDNPGTVPANILPLCVGRNGCNNSKNNAHPEEWLIWKFGEERAAEILARIEAYFDWVSQQGGR